MRRQHQNEQEIVTKTIDSGLRDVKLGSHLEQLSARIQSKLLSPGYLRVYHLRIGITKKLEAKVCNQISRDGIFFIQLHFFVLKIF